MNVPFVDLKAQYLSIKDEIDKAISQVLQEASFIGGEYVKVFEKQFAEFIGTKHCISCGNGTDSIEILLKALNIGQGDEVIIPAYSWISTSEAVSNVGATPVFVDIEQDYYCINPDLIEEKITERTKAIIPVHFYGQAANMPRIMEIANKYNLKVLEDCAQAHGAEINSKKVGTWGACASFSFYPGKNLGAYGDAGAMLTHNDAIAEKARRIANHGQLLKHDHQIEGRNSRLDALQAAVLSVKLSHLEQWTIKRIENASYYGAILNQSYVKTPQVRPNSKHVFHLYVVRIKNRDKVQEKLKEAGIQTAIHYPKALPFLDCYKERNFTKDDFPIAWELQSEILSLPMYPELNRRQIDYVANKLTENYV